MPRRTVIPRWAALAFLLVGGYVLLLSLGIVEARPRPGARVALLASPQHGSVTLFGLALLSFALNIAFPMAPKRWLKLNAALGSLAFMAAMLWFIWFTGMPMAEKLMFSAPLAITLIGVVWVKLKGVETVPDLDALEAAQVLRRHGRPDRPRPCCCAPSVTNPGVPRSCSERGRLRVGDRAEQELKPAGASSAGMQNETFITLALLAAAAAQAADALS